jgi:hypothetical protein
MQSQCRVSRIVSKENANPVNSHYTEIYTWPNVGWCDDTTYFPRLQLSMRTPDLRVSLLPDYSFYISSPFTLRACLNPSHFHLVSLARRRRLLLLPHLFRMLHGQILYFLVQQPRDGHESTIS